MKRLEIGEYGELEFDELPSGQVQCRGRYRGPDGVVRQKKASAPNRRLARQTWIKDVTELCAAGVGEDGQLSRASSVEELAHAFIEAKVKEGVRPQSIVKYESTLRAQVLPECHAWRVDEMTTLRLDALLDRIHASDRDTAAAHKMLSGLCGFAVRKGLLVANPVRDVTRRRKSDLEKAESEARPFDSAYDVEAVDALILEWMEYGRKRPGPNPTNDLRDFTILLAGTGVRPSEGLSLVWTDLNLLAPKPYVDVATTLVYVPGRGNFRQALPKTDSSRRRLLLPPLVVAMLLRRQTEQGADNSINAVFPARGGAWPSLNKYELRLREALIGSDYEWVVFKTYRRTVATAIRRAQGAQAAADQLGHATTAIQDRFYVPDEHHGPDAVALLSDWVLGALDIKV